MFTRTKFVSLLCFLTAVPLAFAASANAASETVTATTQLTPRSGNFFKEVNKASNLRIKAQVSTPASSPLVNPLKHARITFPAGVTFKPNNRLTPVCTDRMLSGSSSLNAPARVIASCPRSIVGTGTATIILAKVNNNPNTVIDDPVLVIFNAGRTNKGHPRVKIWGYSKYTNVGILMKGTLVKRVLNVAIPVLSSDSAVRDFQFDLPGPRLNRPELGIDVRGRDGKYIQARCASGTFRTSAVFQLGERDPATGIATSPTVTANAPATTQNCRGVAGRAKLRVVKVRGPNAVKRGRKAVFRVTVRNPGTASARNVVVRSNRGGKARPGKIAPRANKTVRVKVRMRGKKGRRIAVRFIARSGKLKAAKVKRVRIR